VVFTYQRFVNGRLIAHPERVNEAPELAV